MFNPEEYLNIEDPAGDKGRFKDICRKAGREHFCATLGIMDRQSDIVLYDRVHDGANDFTGKGALNFSIRLFFAEANDYLNGIILRKGLNKSFQLREGRCKIRVPEPDDVKVKRGVRKHGQYALSDSLCFAFILFKGDNANPIRRMVCCEILHPL